MWSSTRCWCAFSCTWREAGALPRHRHPCRRRPLRPRRRGGAAQRRMARGHRSARARADRSARARAACPLSRRGRRLQRRGTPDHLPRFARARARVPARAGSARRLRARAERGGCARAQSRRRPAQQGGDDRRLDRAQRLLPPKERRGLVLVDPAFEDAGDFARLAQALAAAHRNGRAASTSPGTRSRSARRPMRWRAACARAAWPKSCAPNSPSPRRARRRD